MELAGDGGLFWVYNLVCCMCLTGDVSTGWTRYSSCLFSTSFGAVVVACTGGLSFFYEYGR